MGNKGAKLLFEGTTKNLYQSDDETLAVLHFKDTIKLENGKTAEIEGKGCINNRISEFLMSNIEQIGIDTHFVKTLNMREQLIKPCLGFPIEVAVRNISAGRFASRFGIEEGVVLPKPICEYYLKKDKAGYPLISEDHIITLGIADRLEIDEIKFLSLRINDFLRGMFATAGLRLIDFKIEFGRLITEDFEQIVVIDELSAETCRLWDAKSNQRFDKDLIKTNKNELKKAYTEVARRLGLIDTVEKQ